MKPSYLITNVGLMVKIVYDHSIIVYRVDKDSLTGQSKFLKPKGTKSYDAIQ